MPSGAGKTLDEALIFAILSMDAYNRGYGRSLSGFEAFDANWIGGIRISESSQQLGSTDSVRNDESEGFFAQSYAWGGRTVISFRGTDDPSFLSSDQKNWTLALGAAGQGQAGLALEFYQAITGLNPFGSSTDGSIVLTGDSLGGGLAGYVGSIAGADMVGFNHMPFGPAVVDTLVRPIDALVALVEQGGDRRTKEELRQHFQLLQISIAEDNLDALKDIYDQLYAGTPREQVLAQIDIGAYGRQPSINSALVAYHIEGEALEGVRNGSAQLLVGNFIAGSSATLSLIFPNAAPAFLLLRERGSSLSEIGLDTARHELLVDNTALTTFGAFDDAGFIGEKLAKHKISLLVTLLYAEANDVSPDWRDAAEFVLPNLYNAGIAQELGFVQGDDNRSGDSTGEAAIGDQLATAIAYSALPGGTDSSRPFGNVALASFFDDSVVLGRALRTTAEDSIIHQLAPHLGESIAQLSALFAVNDVESGLGNYYDARLLTQHSGSITINFTDDVWGLLIEANNVAITNGGTTVAIRGRESISAALVPSDPDNSAIMDQELAQAMDLVWSYRSLAGFELFDGFDLFTQVTSENVSSTDLASSELGGRRTDSLVVGGDGADNVVAVGEYDVIYGLGGNDILTGGSILFGGEGDDVLIASGSRTYLDGGAGNNLIVSKRYDDIIAVDSGLEGTTTIVADRDAQLIIDGIEIGSDFTAEDGTLASGRRVYDEETDQWTLGEFVVFQDDDHRLRLVGENHEIIIEDYRDGNFGTRKAALPDVFFPRDSLFPDLEFIYENEGSTRVVLDEFGNALVRPFSVTGTSGDDAFTRNQGRLAPTGDSVLSLGAGSDYILTPSGRLAKTTIFAGAGADLIKVWPANIPDRPTGWVDVYGDAGPDTFILDRQPRGAEGIEARFFGGSGEDRFQISSNPPVASLIDGGAGYDFVEFYFGTAPASTAVHANSGLTFDLVSGFYQFDGLEAVTQIRSIEQVALATSDADDTIITLGGSDIINVAAGVNFVSSGAGHDSITAGGSGEIRTGSGNDRIRFDFTQDSQGTLLVDAGEGDDSITLRGDAERSGLDEIIVQGGAGDDFLDLVVGNYRLILETGDGQDLMPLTGFDTSSRITLEIDGQQLSGVARFVGDHLDDRRWVMSAGDSEVILLPYANGLVVEYGDGDQFTLYNLVGGDIAKTPGSAPSRYLGPEAQAIFGIVFETPGEGNRAPQQSGGFDRLSLLSIELETLTAEQILTQVSDPDGDPVFLVSVRTEASQSTITGDIRDLDDTSRILQVTQFTYDPRGLVGSDTIIVEVSDRYDNRSVFEIDVNLEDASLQEGTDTADRFQLGNGTFAFDGGSNVDTANAPWESTAFAIDQISEGVFRIAGTTLTNIEFVQFTDTTIRLLPGEGEAVNFFADPSGFMTRIRDFDGNDLGGHLSWLRIGEADLNGDGDIEQIFVNEEIGRWASVGQGEDSLVYFGDYGWAGETRVVGIYIDPLVESGDVEAGSDFDSQRRFQNDLEIENIGSVLGWDDYDGDGTQEVYFALKDGTAYLRALMHADGNIRYANYQNEHQVRDYLEANGFGEETYGDWFGNSENEIASNIFAQAPPMMAISPEDIFQPEVFG